jgi:adenylate cyclase
MGTAAHSPPSPPYGPADRYLTFTAAARSRVPYQVVLKPELQMAALQHVDLKGKVVFVGYSDLAEPEQPDRFYTVFTDADGVDLSGVEIMATAFANLLTDRSLRLSSMAMTLTITLVFGFTVGAALYLLPALIGVAFGLAVSFLYVAAAQWSFNAADLWLPLAVPILVQMPLATLVGVMGQYLVERREEDERAISHYLPESIRPDREASDQQSTGSSITALPPYVRLHRSLKKSPTTGNLVNVFRHDRAFPARGDITNFHADNRWPWMN